MAQLFQQRDPIERFIEKIDFTDDCWIWTAGRSTKGYGSFHPISELAVGAHDYGWETFVGPVAEGLELDHLCRNPLCVNPDHLEPVTHAENLRRSAPAQKTHCLRGHEFTPENTMSQSRGTGRKCRTCHNAVRMARYYRLAEAGVETRRR